MTLNNVTGNVMIFGVEIAISVTVTQSVVYVTTHAVTGRGKI
ncbi:hypothetical protein [Escherichia coli]|nr:hypothetical protein [Escherichia coli]